jgi:hypothetical protein
MYALVATSRALLQQYPTFHDLSLGAELGNTATHPTLSHFVPYPDACSCDCPVPPSGWKSKMTCSGALPVYPLGRCAMNVRDLPPEVMV